MTPASWLLSATSALLIQSAPIETDLLVPGIPETDTTWVEMIRAAKTEIHIEQMYVADQPGSRIDPIFAELRRAGNRGVRIQMILSQNMIDSDPAGVAKLRAIPGLELRTIDLRPLTGGIQHAKIWIVDGKLSFVGSQNLDWRAIEHIHEVGVLLRDAASARTIDRIFQTDWEIARTGRLPEPSTRLDDKGSDELSAVSAPEIVASPSALNPSGVAYSLDRLLSLIHNAKTSLDIQLMDYSPLGGCPEDPNAHPGRCYWGAIDGALRRAATRGVKIRMALSHWNTEPAEVPHLKSLALIPGIEIRIVTVPTHSSGFIPYARVIHSKYMIVDGTTLWTGTSNWSEGYFKGTRGVELIFKKDPIATQTQTVFERVWLQPYSVPVRTDSVFPPPRKGP